MPHDINAENRKALGHRGQGGQGERTEGIEGGQGKPLWFRCGALAPDLAPDLAPEKIRNSWAFSEKRWVK